MRKTLSLLGLAVLVSAGTAQASGYRIPEQSVDATAKAGAHIASADGADSSYYNPANMAWMTTDTWQVEGDLTSDFLIRMGNFLKNRNRRLHTCLSWPIV